MPNMLADGVAVSWTQTPDEVLVRVPVEESVRGRDIAFEVHPKRLALRVGGNEVLAGTFEGAGDVDPDVSFWTLESDDGGKFVSVTLTKKAMGYNSWESLLESEKADMTVTDRVWLEVTIGGESVGKLVLGLFGKVVPKTVENFKSLVTGDKGDGPSGKPLHYKGSPFHRIIPGFMAQGGDTTLGNGFGGESIFGEKFADENFKAHHEERGMVAMANSGPNTNGSQFYILFEATPHLDGKHVVFGRVETGMQLLADMEAVGSSDGKPTAEVMLSDCGVCTSDEEVQAIIDANKERMLS